jgi:hypothetical protein
LAVNLFQRGRAARVTICRPRRLSSPHKEAGVRFLPLAFPQEYPDRLSGIHSGAEAAILFGSMRTLPAFDSLAAEADGNICVATLVRGGISVFSRGGVWMRLPTSRA